MWFSPVESTQGRLLGRGIYATAVLKSSRNRSLPCSVELVIVKLESFMANLAPTQPEASSQYNCQILCSILGPRNPAHVQCTVNIYIYFFFLFFMSYVILKPFLALHCKYALPLHSKCCMLFKEDVWFALSKNLISSFCTELKYLLNFFTKHCRSTGNMSGK